MVDGQAGKGSKYRSVNQERYAENWEKAFGCDKKKCCGKGCQNSGFVPNKNSKKGQMQPGGIIDHTDIPQSEEEDDKIEYNKPGIVEDWKDN